MSAYRCEFPAWADWYEASATPTRTQISACIGGGYLATADANGAYVGYQVATAAGTFTLRLLYVTYLSNGKFQMSIDGVDVGALTDSYAAGAVRNNLYEATGLALTEGAHTIRMTANGKNASSSGHTLHPQWFSLERTGA